MNGIDGIRARDAAVAGKRRTEAEHDRHALLVALDATDRERASLMWQLEEASRRNAADREAFLAERATWMAREAA
jgi:hypothetical protein